MTVSITFQELTVQFKKSSGDPITAVDHLNLQIDAGQIFGLLGPNGSGKTTTVNMLSGLLKPSSGQVLIYGEEVARNVARARTFLGVVPQETALYNDLTAYENLLFHARLYKVPRDEQKQRIEEVLVLSGLTDRQHDRVGTYSGGMQRRLALARALLTRPTIVVLDEPTLGVDVQSRAAIWERVRQIADEGKTVLLTTNYMEEAQELADYLAIIDHGKLIDQGSPATLKQQVGQTFIDIEAEWNGVKREALQQLSGVTNVEWHTHRVRVTADSKADVMPKLLDFLQHSDITPHTITMRQPDLNDVFLNLTGRALRN